MLRLILTVLALTLGNSAYADFMGFGDTAVKGAEAYKTIEEVNNMQGLMFLVMGVALFKAVPFLKYLTPLPYIRIAFAAILWVIGVFMIMLMYVQFEPYFVNSAMFLMSFLMGLAE